MDYSQLSDAEIAQKVWFWWNQNIEHDNTLCCISGGKMIYVKNSVWTAFDPCNNPADAWPIITANKISIYAMSEEDKRGLWGAEAFYPNEAYHFNNNPLRAAMIAILMVQDAKHA